MYIYSKIVYYLLIPLFPVALSVNSGILGWIKVVIINIIQIIRIRANETFGEKPRVHLFFNIIVSVRYAAAAEIKKMAIFIKSMLLPKMPV